MSKPAALFVAAAMAVTAGCVSVVAGQGLGLDLAGSVLVGFASLAGMAVTHLAFLRAAPKDDGRLDDIDRVVTDLQNRLETLELRVSGLDGAAGERARAATRPLVDEIAALGALVTTVAKEVAAHDVAITRLALAKVEREAIARAEPAPAPKAKPRPAPQPEPEASAPEPKPVAAPRRIEAKITPPEPFDLEDEAPGAEADASDLLRRIDRALADDRIEAHLQPVVTLPNRRTAHYEAFARLVEQDGLLPAEAFLPAAIAHGRIGEIDRRVIERSAAIALRLSARGGGAVFCNIAPETLRDASALAAISGLFEKQAELRRLIILEIPQASFEGLGVEEAPALEGLTATGVRLSLDKAENLTLEPRELARRGVRFVKTPATRLLDPDAAKGATIHPADLASLFSRHGVELIATHVEGERTVPELLDMEVRFGQGLLFGAPRPARPASAQEPRAEHRAAAQQPRLVPRSVGAR
ncbi:EAL domain-containing protein [Hansschlegelia zhihuaiae]|uniref:EAL domain-containing protein n=1 Tax=Hansschlegelia zhihuaiae TaxID=405005 RepID=A0A4Q0MKW3_9HYPH|nr:EAL domain-containing protein [Hansschlegelia zhihuaiae]RXF74103.1 EAL domain-containing protein [Hansschlegelia zhihuaiae]